jgi:hypothetical protein
MSTRCPNGHDSADAEWCDTCGARLGAPSAPTAPPATGPPEPSLAPVAQLGTPCPSCECVNPAWALFCEECGYDFTTGQRPDPVAEPAATAEDTGGADGVDVAAAGASASPDEGDAKWVLVVEVDPDWFQLKGSLADEPCPPASTATVPLRSHSSLVGRSSQSRGIHPEVALESDTGVSRRHAQLVLSGEALSVVDLSSTNGTYVVTGDQQPDDDLEPLAPGVAHPLGDGDRIYVGAWTRLTARRSS